MKNHHISEAGVSFENIVWSVYQDMGWRTHFLHMAANYRLKTCSLSTGPFNSTLFVSSFTPAAFYI